MAFHGGTPFVRGNLRQLIQRMEKDFFSFNVMILIRNSQTILTMVNTISQTNSLQFKNLLENS